MSCSYFRNLSQFVHRSQPMTYVEKSRVAVKRNMEISWIVMGKPTVIAATTCHSRYSSNSLHISSLVVLLQKHGFLHLRFYSYCFL